MRACFRIRRLLLLTVWGLHPGWTPAVVASLPAGTDGAAVFAEDTVYTFHAEDFGFSDPGDQPENRFAGIRLTTAPLTGSLRVDGVTAYAGTFLPMQPVLGREWTPRLSGSWTAVACSADGARVITAGVNTRLMVSADYGVTWEARGPQHDKWNGVASSADGMKLAAVGRSADGGHLYTSADGGETWTERDEVRWWSAVASSADGTRLVAAVTNGQLYVSSDSGLTWLPQATSRNWMSVASSANGARLVAADVAGGIYTSSDFGASWASRVRDGRWYAVASSADGMRLIAGELDSGELMRSIDGGGTWAVVLDNNSWWRSVASSANGMKLIAVGDLVYVSEDGGQEWTLRSSNTAESWQSAAITADGARLYAGGYSKPLQTSVPSLPVLTYVPQAHSRGTPAAAFSFAVQDDGPEPNVDPVPNEFRLNITSVNDAPVAALAVADLFALVSQPFSYQFPAGSFTDVDAGTVFTYTASLADGAPLPAWLSFASSTRTFSGTPAQGDAGIMEVKLTATDDGTPPLSASLVFRLRSSREPQGTDGSIFLDEDTTREFSIADFGFTDANETVPSRFSRVKVTTAPTSGNLYIDNILAPAGSYAAMVPVARTAWAAWNSAEPLGICSSLASSADGQRLAACFSPGFIHTSADGGATWEMRHSQQYWRTITCSADGLRLAAASSGPNSAGGQIHTSTDGGVTWVPRESTRHWNSLSSSADGMKLLASVNGGYLYTSSDGGQTWSERAQAHSWRSTASSSDGMRLAAIALNTTSPPTGTEVFTSTDSGMTWQLRSSSADGNYWTGLAMSADGMKLAALSGVIRLSTDGGSTWRYAPGTTATWSSIATSLDGVRLVASRYPGMIYTSSDSGATWLPHESSRSWGAVASSADGYKLAAGSDASIYTSTAAVPRFHYRPTLNGNGSPFATFTFQVEDEGLGVRILDPTPNTMTIHVAPVADAPALSLAIPDQSATESVAFNYAFPATTFSDADAGTVFTYRAEQADGSPLPAWLTFNAATRTFSGTPGPLQTGALQITVIAMDNGVPPQSASDTFQLVVVPVDNPPRGSDTTQILAEDTTLSLGPASFGFSDPDDRFPNQFASVKLTTLPSAGQLAINGVPVLTVGGSCRMNPVTGEVWTLRQPTPATQSWYGVAISADGMKLAAAVNFGRLYTSTDAGATWTARESSRGWYDIASSADGQRLAAVDRGGLIYLSVDGGVTWTARESARNWRSIASSSDGTKLAAVHEGGQIYVSTDAGANWTARAENRTWYGITVSDDGQRLAAVDRNGFLYTSADAGLTWNARASSHAWRSITASSDGTKLAAIVSSGFIYTSADAGLTWTATGSSRNWLDICSSADGSVLAAVAANDRVYISTNAGQTWTARESSRNWRTITASADGTKLAAAVSGGQIYTSTPLPAQALTYRPAPDASGIPYAQFTFQVEDDGAFGLRLDPAPRTFIFEVRPVNDQPTLNAISDISPLTSENPLPVPLSGISAGGGESQTLTASAVSGNPAFVPHPAVTYASPAATGSLTLQAAPGSYGSAVITVIVQDNGGTADGGMDTQTRSFTVRRPSPFQNWAAENNLPADPAAAEGAYLLRFAFGLDGRASARPDLIADSGGVIQRGFPAVHAASGPAMQQAVFARRKDAALTYIPQFSHDLTHWESSSLAPVKTGEDAVVEAFSLPFPTALSDGREARYFRLRVTTPVAD